MLKRKTSRWPPPTKWQVMLMGTYLAHRQLCWDYQDMKKALRSAHPNAKQTKYQPWLAYHGTTL